MSAGIFFVKKTVLPILLSVGLASPAIAQYQAEQVVKEGSQIIQPSVNPEVYQTVVIPKSYNLPNLYLYQATWLVEDTIKLRELTICERVVLKAPEGKYLTLSVNGIGKQIQPGTYKGDVVLSVTDNFMSGFNSMSPTPRYFHTAVFIEDGKVVPEKSTPALVLGGEVTDTRAEEIYIASEEESFNGIILEGNSEYTINDAKIDLDGFGDNDYIGVGSAVRTSGNSKVTINDSEFTVNGVTRCVMHFDGKSVVTLNNCKLFQHSPATDWVNKFFCWQIGFRGASRVVQHAGAAAVNYNNCYIKGNGWCLCSIDGGNNIKMYFKDSTLELHGPRSHGYGVFCMGTHDITYDHSTFDVNGYPLFMMGTRAKVNIINGTVIKGRRFGVFCNSDKSSVVNIKDSTFQTEKSNLCIKGSSITFNIDNTVMKAKNGIVVQLMDSEENGMNQLDFKVPVGVVDKAIPGRDLTRASPGDDVQLNIANSNIKGNFFNSTTDIRAYKNSIYEGQGRYHDNVRGSGASQAQQAALGISSGMMGGAPSGVAAPGAVTPGGGAAPGGAAPSEGMGPMGMPKDLLGPKNLGLNFTNVKVEGIISSATQAYREGLTVILPEIREELSNVTQTAAEAVNNGVIVSFDKDCIWTVTGTSYLTSLTVAQGAVIKAPEGKKLTMLVNGKKTYISAGKYIGKIELVVN